MEEKKIEETPESSVPYPTPLPSTYSLFEDKPYLQILREKISKFKEFSTSITTLVEKELEFKKHELETEIRATLLDIAILLVQEKYIDNKLFERLRQAESFDEFKEIYSKLVKLLKEKGILDDIFKKYKNKILYLVDLYREYNSILLSMKDLQKRKEIYELYEKVYSKFLDLLEIYPKHLRMGVLNEFEIKATRFITDTYFTILARGLIFDDLKSLQEAFFVIAPYIINIQETSLSKEGFFLRLVASSPLIQSMPEVPEESGEEINLADLIKTEGKLEAEKNVRPEILEKVLKRK